MASEKRQLQENSVIQVFGFGRSWTFVNGATAGEATDFVARRHNRAVEDVAMEDISSSSGGVILVRGTQLVAGRRYVFIPVVKPVTAPKRTFAVGGIADPEKHYYLAPDVALLVSKLKGGRYCVLTGARQTGKSTMAMACKAQLSMEPGFCVVYLDKVNADGMTSKSMFWGLLWDHLHGKCSLLFPAKPSGEQIFTEWNFKSLFLKQNLPLKVILIVDEADTLLSAPPDFLGDLFSTLKGMRDDTDYNFNGILLVGVETVKDFLAQQRHHRRNTAAEQNIVYTESPSPSRYSPFSHSFLAQPGRFGVEHVEDLLRQAESERPGVKIAVERIATSVIELTGGHKGIVGSCLDYLVNNELWNSRQWIEEAESGQLVNYVFGQQTFGRILKSFRSHAAGKHFDLLKTFLAAKSRHCDEEMVVQLRNLIAEGVLQSQPAAGGGYDVQISSPLLRDVIFRRCVVTSDSVNPPPDPYGLDHLWVIMEALRSFDGESMCRPDCLKATGEISEYSFQFVLFTRLKAIFRQAYPFMDIKVLPESKQAVEYLEKRDTQERVDILVRNNNNFTKFAFERVVNDDVEGHMLKAVRYASQHSALVFVINFTMEDTPEIQIPEHASVVFVSVQLNPNGNQTSAKVTIVDIDGPQPVMDLELTKWDGKMLFDHI
ncbi:hypothetical protein SELMODRAFT_410363 [Selaginella moellendorffii]|uniref:Uncharacterized protein n=1 Tax=Selaginella moellendorffii TaxID=88036 RepID=D8REI8_SELML|nr:hypothetical protein SELMODRAFT_410363 [Selaginella moellendorffii]